MARNVVDNVMQALAKAKRDLVKEAQKIADDIGKIDAFLHVRGKGVRRRMAAAAKGSKRGGKRRISAAGRARIAAAQRRRWAKVRAAKKAKASAKA